MLIVAPDGHIINVLQASFSNEANNDEAIFTSMVYYMLVTQKISFCNSSYSYFADKSH